MCIPIITIITNETTDNNWICYYLVSDTLPMNGILRIFWDAHKIILFRTEMKTTKGVV